MKVSLALLVAVIGFSLVAAEYNLEERLKMALKRLLQGEPEGKKEDLEMETRDGFADCERDTKKCDGNGKCQKSAPGGSYICFCDAGYVSNSYGGCSEADAREIEYLSNIARDVELEMLTRDTLARCNRDTKNCDGFGRCEKSTFGRTTGQYICKCNEGYDNNVYGGCSPRPSDQDEGGENEREFKLDILRRLVNLLAE